MARLRVAILTVLLASSGALAACSRDAEPATASSASPASSGDASSTPPGAPLTPPPSGAAPAADQVEVVSPALVVRDIEAPGCEQADCHADPASVSVGRSAGETFVVRYRTVAGVDRLREVDGDGEARWDVALGFAPERMVVDDVVVLGGASQVEVRSDPSGTVRWHARGVDDVDVAGGQVLLTTCTDGERPGCTVRARAADTGLPSWTRRFDAPVSVDLPARLDVLVDDIVSTAVLSEPNDTRSVLDLATGRTLGDAWTGAAVATASGLVVNAGQTPTADGCDRTLVGVDLRGRRTWRTVVPLVRCEGRVVEVASYGDDRLLLHRAETDVIVDTATGAVLAEGRKPSRRLVAESDGVVVSSYSNALPDGTFRGDLRAVTATGDVLWTLPLTSSGSFVLDGWLWLPEIAMRVRLDDGRVQSFEPDDTYHPPFRGAGSDVERDQQVTTIGDGWASSGGLVWLTS